MSALFESIRLAWNSYSMTTINMILYWLAMVWLFLFEKKKKENILFWYAAFIPVMLLLMQISCFYLLPGRSLGKMFLLLPVGILMSYTAVRIAESGRGTKKTWIIVLLYAIMIQAGITMRYNSSVLQGGLNCYKISPSVEWMAYYIGEDEKLNEPYVLAPSQIASQIQEYDASIRVAYGEGYSYTGKDLDELLTEMDSVGCNCLIVRYDEEKEEYIKHKGYRLIVIHDNYAIYARK